MRFVSRPICCAPVALLLGSVAVRRGYGDHHAPLADSDPADAVMDRDLGQFVLRLQRPGDVGHELLGHPFVGLVLEVRDRPAAGVDPRRADERRHRAGVV